MLRDGRAVLFEPVEALPMDGDLYQSTMDALTNLYDKVSAVGFIIVDDYRSWSGCKQAIDEFRNERSIASEM